MLTTNDALQQGRYRIIQRLGHDEKTPVYEAFDNVLETNVTLKEIPVQLQKIATASQRATINHAFASSAKVLTEIKHRSFLSVHDYFSDIDRQYLVMESVEGENLYDLLEKNKKPFAISDVADWADQLLDALNYLHTQVPPIIHRDIKPQNIKLTADGKIKLLTFNFIGNAESLSAESAANKNFDAELLHFLPLELIWEGLDSASQKVIAHSYDEKSEMILKQPADARSDIYAFGATLYYLLTARKPTDALERSIDILEEKPDPLAAPAKLNPDVPPVMSEAILRALEIKRENRFESAQQMRQALRPFFECFVKTASNNPKSRTEEEFLLEVPVAEQKILEEERLRLEKEKLRIETEKKREKELLERQLREAEEQRLLAEQRAAEAEKLLLEKEKTAAENKENKKAKAATASKTAENSNQNSAGEEISAAAEKQTESTDDEFGNLFASAQKPAGSAWKLPVIALALLLIGGGAFGFWFMQSKNAAPEQAVSKEVISPAKPAETAPTANVETKAETPAETAPANTAETVAETAASPEETAPEVVEPSAANPAYRNRSVAQQPAPRVRKQTASAAKPPAEQKKAVTVDDLINGN
jgi:serine/threonine protein kinase